MEHLSKARIRRICKILMQQNNQEEKKLKKHKVVNTNIKKYNKIGQLKIKRKINNQKLNEITEKIRMLDAIMMVKVNVKDQNYKIEYDCQQDDQHV